jgi:glutaminyl-tRNA synthetase
MDDTNPETEDVEYVEAIIRDVKWLGFDWGKHLYFASDYFEEFYRLAEGLVEKGLAYVDSSSEEEIREHRGTVTEPGRPTRYRDRPVAENLALLRRMREGEFPDGAHVLRAKIDLASPNMLMRDPILYRIRHSTHYRRGDAWCIYPLYDYAHPLEDAIECVTHSLCTLEFENNRELYDWVVENCDVKCRPYQTEFARLELDYTVVSKRKLLQLVERRLVSGWDDPRLPTLAGLRRRGVPPEAIRNFAEMVGVAKTNSRVDIGKLEYAIRDDLNQRAPRVLCVLDPLRVVITNWPVGKVEQLDAPYWPHDVPKQGSRKLPFAGEIYIERSDFAEDPPRGFFRLSPGREVRLRYGWIIRCDEVIKDAAGKVIELRCSYDPETRGGATPDGRVVKGTIHWVSAEYSIPCEVRLYDRLFTDPDPESDPDGDFMRHLNPRSLVVMNNARIEPSVTSDAPGSCYQFERLGYFVSDELDSQPHALVFNRTVTLRDTWARIAQPEAESPGRPRRESATETARAKEAAAAPSERIRTRTPEVEARYQLYMYSFKLSEEAADILARDPSAARFFDEALATLQAKDAAQTLANWIIHDLPREAKGRPLSDLPFGGKELVALTSLVEAGTLSSSAARDVLSEMAEHGGDPATIVERKGLSQLSDTTELASVIQQVLAANPGKVQDYRNGRTGLLGFFVGQVMHKTGGRANPVVVHELLRKQL